MSIRLEFTLESRNQTKSDEFFYIPWAGPLYKINDTQSLDIQEYPGAALIQRQGPTFDNPMAIKETVNITVNELTITVNDQPFDLLDTQAKYSKIITNETGSWTITLSRKPDQEVPVVLISLLA